MCVALEKKIGPGVRGKKKKIFDACRPAYPQDMGFSIVRYVSRKNNFHARYRARDVMGSS